MISGARFARGIGAGNVRTAKTSRLTRMIIIAMAIMGMVIGAIMVGVMRSVIIGRGTIAVVIIRRLGAIGRRHGTAGRSPVIGTPGAVAAIPVTAVAISGTPPEVAVAPVPA